MNHIDENIIRLMQLKGVGRQKVKQLLDMITVPQSLNLKEIVEIGQTFHIIPNQIGQIEIEAARDDAKRLIDECDALGIRYISYLADGFPACLNFSDSPVLLYYQGDLEVLNQPKRAAVIGSRLPSQMGSDFAFQAGKVLAENNFVVISGLAVGADFAGHSGCLAADGKTVAILPSGLAPVYPASNRGLAEKICDQGGCLISEYNHHEMIQPYKFIERDRLQSGTSQFVIVSNFAPGSGTIHTLDYANKYKRPIYSIPLIYEESRDGFNYLSQKGIGFKIVENTGLAQLIENY
ncbi:MAG: DNA-protecting protein DprA [Acetobacterium sp.]|nr:DNA-protecting protein DprA [Acetobacterium sp.]